MENKLSIEERLNLLDDRLNSIMKMMCNIMDKESQDDSMEEKVDENNSLLNALIEKSDKKQSYMPYVS